MADLQLQRLSRQVYSLDLRIGVITYSLMNVDLATANLQLQINKLRNIQVGLRSQATAQAQKLRMELAELASQYVTTTAQAESLEQNLQDTRREKQHTQARLEYLREVTRRQVSARVPRDRGGGMARGRRKAEKHPWKMGNMGYW